MGKTVNIFISSTFKDLASFREQVSTVILDLKANPIGMENFGANITDSVQTCYNEIENAELFVGIYADRYGYVPAKDSAYFVSGEKRLCDGETSLTHMEYQWATERHLPQLLFVLDDEAAPVTSPGSEEAERLGRFKKIIGSGHVYDKFRTPEELGAKVATALAKTEEINRHLKEIIASRAANDPIKRVFLSFNRNIDQSVALLMESQLMERGFDPFIMFLDERTPEAEQYVENQMTARSHVLVILSPNSLTGSLSNLDAEVQLRREIQWAAQHGRHVVALLVKGAEAAGMQEIFGQGNVPKIVDLDYSRIEDGLTKISQLFNAAPPIRCEAISENSRDQWLQEYILRAKQGQSNAIAVQVERAEQAFTKAIASARKESYRDALAAYQEAIDYDPNLTSAYLGCGQALYKLGSHEKALEYINKAVQRDAMNFYGYWLRAQILAALGRDRDALQDYFRAIKIAEQQQQYYREQANYSRALKNKTNENIYALYADKVTLHAGEMFFELGNRHLLLLNNEEAAKSFRNSIRLHEGLPKKYLQLGRVYRALGNPEEAVKAFTDALRLDAEFPEAHFERAFTRFEQDARTPHLADIRKDCEAELDRNPNHSAARYYYARTLYELDEPYEAIDEMRSLLEREPEKIEAHYYLAVFYAGQKKNDKAMAAYKRVINAPAEVSTQAFVERACNNLGVLYHRQGDYQSAAVYYQQAIQFAPNRWEYHSNLGGASFELEQFQYAYYEFNTAIGKSLPDKRKKSRFALRMAIAICLYMMGNTPEAVKQWHSLEAEIKPPETMAGLLQEDFSSCPRLLQQQEALSRLASSP